MNARESTVHLGRAATPSEAAPLRAALLGNPNCGKTALFNLLTGARQKVANYAGVTVERKEGWLTTPGKRRVRLLDLPGTYSLDAHSEDERITRDIVTGEHAREAPPELLVCVTDATHLRLNLRLVLEARALGLPMLLVLNMSDMARRQGLQIDTAQLSALLGVPVVESVGVHQAGARDLLAWLDSEAAHRLQPPVADPRFPIEVGRNTREQLLALHQQVAQIMQATVQEPAQPTQRDDRIDAVVLHPLWGTLLLLVTLFLIFQAVFSWAEPLMDGIEGSVAFAGEWLSGAMPEGVLRSLLVDGVIAGTGSVLVFLPQILILFFFILVLEDSGYLPRAAFLLDRIMGTVGLSGRSFIPLLSSFACAVPGIMATRSIPSWRDRLLTIMIAPLMTCSARLPVYALLIAAFIPDQTVAGVLNLQGLVLFALYIGGILSAMAVAWVAKLGRSNLARTPLLMELPAYRWPSVRSLVIGLYERAMIFLRRVGGIILTVSIVLWFLASYPGAPEGITEGAIRYSYAGQIGHWLEMVLSPIGFNWQIAIALVPAMAAREVAVSALGTVYALSATGDDVAEQLGTLIAHSWSLATALSVLVWFVFAPHCISTLAMVKRETNGWRYPLIMAGYLFGLAYLASFVTYRIAVALGWG
ncbi:ferrous iron transporter B [Comamonas aquatica]|jgi:ferrous iron transport protein B|uniref:ferrous iron transporter B n=1 Tax=Comamonas aquatica TaxID=225991 RepID=UPI001B38D095|nr:ferrous iron transporter B [Comamonas aquatica]QTX19646.1 ferrous iron transporter B [Comamonas aquatica]